MDKLSRSKLHEAGYIFYRACYDHLKKEGKITYSIKHGAWKKHSGGYRTIISLHAALDDIIHNNPKALLD